MAVLPFRTSALYAFGNCPRNQEQSVFLVLPQVSFWH